MPSNGRGIVPRNTRGICRHCLRSVALTKYGLVSKHVLFGVDRTCPGSKQPPRNALDQVVEHLEGLVKRPPV